VFSNERGKETRQIGNHRGEKLEFSDSENRAWKGRENDGPGASRFERELSPQQNSKKIEVRIKSPTRNKGELRRFLFLRKRNLFSGSKRKSAQVAK